MARNRVLTLGSLLTLGVALAACGGQADQSASPTPDDLSDTAITDTTSAAGVLPTADDSASGTNEMPTLPPPPERPTAEAGIRRSTHISEALRVLPFVVLEPKALAGTFYLDATRLTESPEGQEIPGLPTVNMIYQGDPSGVVFILEGPATGEAASGESVEIGGYTGWYTAQPAPVLVWEQDGLRIEMRGREVTKELLLEAAASMAPFESPNE